MPIAAPTFAMPRRMLVLYGTTDGQTRKVALALGEALRATGAEVAVANAASRTRAPQPEAYDAVIVAGSVHAGGYQRALRRWVRAHARALGERRTAFVSVCLGVLEHKPEVDAELLRIREKFFAATGWQPQTVKIVAGALPFRRYNWLKKLMMRRIVAKALGDVDVHRDYEYTDWKDLAEFAMTFAAAGRAAERPNRAKMSAD